MLGAYSVVRYSDNFRDERINVGVVVWHPTGGFEWRFVPSLERVRAINPAARPYAIRQQIKIVQDRLKNESDAGQELMNELSEWLKEGLEFSKPYPTRLTAAAETASRLYEMLVPPPEQPRQAETAFQTKVASILKDELAIVAPKSQLEDLGEQWVAGVRVNIGLHTKVKTTDTLWRTVSMRARADEDKIARAKSAAMDILKIRGLANYSNHQHAVAVDSPPRFAGEGLARSTEWLRDTGAMVIIAPDTTRLSDAIGELLRAA